LRARRLPVADVATRVRLTKSPAAYRASRLREGQYEALLAAGRATWEPGARVRFYRAEGGRYALLPDDDRPRTAGQGAQHDEGALGGRRPMVGLPPYDAEHYVRVLVENYADRLRKAFRPADFAQIFRADAQLGLFDRDVAMIEPLWIRPAL
ncbi:MAG: DNA polymerase, partial [Chloroflexales bacterium]|nr:DNA polymerase [Chloroflexales bacterium]